MSDPCRPEAPGSRFEPSRSGSTSASSSVVRDPFTFSVSQPPFHDQFFVADLTGDGRSDYTFRSRDSLFAYDPAGRPLWSVAVSNPQERIERLRLGLGAAHGTGRLNAAGSATVVALDREGQILVIDGATGEVRRTISIPSVATDTRWVYVAVANLRGAGDRDIVLQAMDTTLSLPTHYLGRSLLAWDLDNDRELWRVYQSSDPTVGAREGFWSPAHGPFRIADVTGDGRDEVVGGNMVLPDGRVVDLGYSREWVRYRDAGFMDHLDAVAIGPVLPDRPGVEWVVTEEGHVSGHFATVLLSPAGLVWRREVEIFSPGADREPQNLAVGNFDPERPDREIWVRSRFPSRFRAVEAETSQHPWVFDASGELIAHYRTVETLPPGFNQHARGNCEGLEMIHTIDWRGGTKDYLAAKARHVDGNVGVFDAMTGKALWVTGRDAPAVQATLIYVADVSGDAREEVIVYDAADGTIKVYGNPEESLNPAKPSKWEDRNYRRIKQVWNYYSP